MEFKPYVKLNRISDFILINLSYILHKLSDSLLLIIYLFL